MLLKEGVLSLRTKESFVDSRVRNYQTNLECFWRLEKVQPMFMWLRLLSCATETISQEGQPCNSKIASSPNIQDALGKPSKKQAS